MARIPVEVVERLKTQVSVQRLAEARGVAFTKHGADLIGRCPFHDDRTPSLVVTPAKNLWHCLGACQAGGTVIDWVMRAEGISFRHALELLLNDSIPLAAGVPLESPPPKHSTVRKLPTTLERNSDPHVQARLRQSHPRLPAAAEEPDRRGGAARSAAAHRAHAWEWP